MLCLQPGMKIDEICSRTGTDKPAGLHDMRSVFWIYVVCLNLVHLWPCRLFENLKIILLLIAEKVVG